MSLAMCAFVWAWGLLGAVDLPQPRRSMAMVWWVFRWVVRVRKECEDAP